jgi:hypothetical protein
MAGMALLRQVLTFQSKPSQKIETFPVVSPINRETIAVKFLLYWHMKVELDKAEPSEPRSVCTTVNEVDLNNKLFVMTSDC